MMRLAILILAAVAAYVFLSGANGDALRAIFAEERSSISVEAQELIALAGTVAALMLVLPAVFSGYRGRVGGAFRDLMSWAVLAIVLVAGYSYRDELGRIGYRIAGELTPPGAAVGVEQGQAGERAVKIRRRLDGHFVARVTVEGTSVSMLVDTGASTVVLRQSDARDLGVDTRRLRYTVPVQTANGLAYAAHARLRQVAVGSIVLTNVDALVAQPGVLKESLLGMSFLSRLRSYEFAGEFLTFRN
ncbi:MAG: TIGR02281 family clan AA aspartic protease [Hyphomicrobiaceae bacterium]|nr:TIGR02281 family clan AA aspartic protease [Hyphomicrobiaceae bacterium]